MAVVVKTLSILIYRHNRRLQYDTIDKEQIS